MTDQTVWLAVPAVAAVGFGVWGRRNVGRGAPATGRPQPDVD